jgi:hypothetical protein
MYALRIPAAGPLLPLKLRMHVTSTAVFIHVVLFPPMHITTHICPHASSHQIAVFQKEAASSAYI